MRHRIASAYRNPAVRFIAIALLAGTAAGCSSDATRFDSFYASAENLKTNSIQYPTNAVNGRVPTPSADLQQANAMPPRSNLGDPLNQPMPPMPQQGQVYGMQPQLSAARTISDSPIQTSSLSAPLPPAAPSSTAAAKMPVRNAADTARNAPRMQMIKGPDPVSTGTVAASGATPAKPEAPKQVAAIETHEPARVPVPTQVPHHEAVVPTAPQPETKKTAQAEAKDGGKSNTYKVASGDSLIEIARKNGVSVEALRVANGLSSNAIRAGQELKIPASGSNVKVAEKPAEKITADDIKTSSVPATKAEVAATQKPAPATAAKESVSTATETQVASTAPAETGIGKYRWPATGAVIAAFGANVDGQRNDGIDISVPEGTPVKAAENGVVIYAGNGLEKLGNTVLIRHSDGKVTVYAHLKSIDVNRGDKVNRGQVVADSGMSGNASRPKLHFEVRKNSAPVNPMSFLE